MDNRIDLPGYRYFVDVTTGERPDCYVTFLNLEAVPSGSVNGVLLQVDEQTLEALDRRERNYRRVPIVGGLSPSVTGPVWCYLATEAGQERFRQGAAFGAAVVNGTYCRAVESAFKAWGDDAYAAYQDTTDPIEVPVRELRQISLP